LLAQLKLYKDLKMKMTQAQNAVNNFKNNAHALFGDGFRFQTGTVKTGVIYQYHDGSQVSFINRVVTVV
tara:strand:+ start:285 stop:491 length:207 start_codon:yes stop_codon:yes gene_type:complete